MSRKVVFLNRDGTVIIEKNYLSNPAEVELEFGAVEGLRRFTSAGFQLVIVSNQSGISRGYFNERQLDDVNNRLADILSSYNLHIASWHHCPHLPTDNCACRKPKPGMLDIANALSPVDWASSMLIGDKQSDVGAAHARGMQGFIVGTGQGFKNEKWAQKKGIKFFNNLVEASEFALKT